MQKRQDDILKQTDDLAKAVGDLAKLWTDGQAARDAHRKDYLDARKDLEKNHKALTDRYNKLVKSDAYKALSTAHKDEVKAELQMVNNIMNSGPNKGTFPATQRMIDDCNETLKDFEKRGRQGQRDQERYQTRGKSAQGQQAQKGVPWTERTPVRSTQQVSGKMGRDDPDPSGSGSQNAGGPNASG